MVKCFCCEICVESDYVLEIISDIAIGDVWIVIDV